MPEPGSPAGGLLLTCPIRGRLKIKAKSADGLTPTEEARRIEAIRHLLSLGYEKEYIVTEPIVRRIGHGGRNSLRADLAVTDIPGAQVLALPPEERVKHCPILVEVKRDNAGAPAAKETQVEPLLAFGPNGCLAVYWDPIEQRVFWHDRNKVTQEGYLPALPASGVRFTGNPKLTFSLLRDADSLLELFDRVEDALHTHGVGKQDRYDPILQLLLAKLHDERINEPTPDEPLSIQNPDALDIDPVVARKRFEELLDSVAVTYGHSLPRPLNTKVTIPPKALVAALAVIAPYRIGHATHQAMQSFFMKFAKDMYRWDLAQYFTPTPLTEFIVDVANPRAMELVKDPGCGSADFLMAAWERTYGTGGKPQLFGADLSDTAAQVAELNCILHDARAKIEVEDTLANIDGPFCVRKTSDGAEDGRYHLLICNPPFGSKIVLTDSSVLAKFDLGHEWTTAENGQWMKTDRIRKSQELGVLFLEACVRQALRNGGRVGIILPNGYLGNRRDVYTVLREWLLRQCYVAAIIGFPRFTFKSSGADVSASVVVLERRREALEQSDESEDYPVAVELIEKVGWQLGQKNGGPAYVRDVTDGAIELDDDNNPMLDADFASVLGRLRAGDAGARFGWLAGAQAPTDPGHTVPVSEIIADPLRCLDPKRYSEKFRRVREAIAAGPHVRLGDVVEVVPELKSAALSKRDPAAIYRYVDISNTGPGVYTSTRIRGWELPSRARHEANPGDIFVGSIWSSVRTWFLAGEPDLIVTNGFHRLRLTDPDVVLDLVAGLCTEAYAVQMRGLARGSDGLAEITADDLRDVVLPRITDPTVRVQLHPFVNQLLHGQQSLKATVAQMVDNQELPLPPVPPRPSHVALV